MRAIVIYESMYGNTHQIAEAIVDGLASRLTATAVPVGQADQCALAGADLLVVGGPTHAWSMSRPATRASAIQQAPQKDLRLDEAAHGPGVREWLEQPIATVTAVAAFDTRLDAPKALTGQASRSILRPLRQRGLAVLDKPRSFLVTRDNHLCPGELDRAREWGRQLATRLMTRAESKS